MDYERGLEQLKQIAQGSDWYFLFTTYEARLLDILEKNALFGASPQGQNELNQIVYELNKLSYQKIQISFNDLCSGTYFHKDKPLLVDFLLPSTQENVKSRPEKPVSTTEIFIGYSKKDQDYFRNFESHLEPYLRKDVLHIWDHSRSIPGTNTTQQIQEALAKADMAILLISADYLSSDETDNLEIKPLIKSAHTGKIRLLNILLRPTRGFQDSALASFSLLNKNEKPVSNMTPTEQETFWGQIIDLLLRK